MPIYCDLNDAKATINIELPDKSKIRFISKHPPVSVEENTRIELGECFYIWAHFGTQPLYRCVKTYSWGAATSGTSPYLTGDVTGIDCNNNPYTYSYFTEDNFWGKGVQPNAFNANPPICGNNNNSCSIVVKEKGNIVYQTGFYLVCPTYNVVCGEDCPPDTIKCFSTNYPGYCCIPCSEIKNEIKAIASQVRSLTNG